VHPEISDEGKEAAKHGFLRCEVLRCKL